MYWFVELRHHACHKYKKKIIAACLVLTLIIYLYTPSRFPRQSPALSHNTQELTFHQLNITISSKDIKLELFNRNGSRKLVGFIGKTISHGQSCKVIQKSSGIILKFTGGTELKISSGERSDKKYGSVLDCYKLHWENRGGRSSVDASADAFRDEFRMKGAHWYGGSAIYETLWPVERWSRRLEAFVTGDSYRDRYGGVQERYWLSSKGVAVFVEYTVPLFVGINESGNGLLTFVSKYEYPYRNSAGVNLFLSYTVCTARNIREMFLSSAGLFWKRPLGIPDERAFRHPIWSTWAMYKNGITQSTVLDMARTIKDLGFNNSHFQIDDGWASHHGDLSFDLTKFPNPTAMITELKDSLGYRITLWVHTFASPFSSAMWLRDSSGTRFWIPWSGVDLPAFVLWWNGLGAVLDLTNLEARAWYESQLGHLKSEYRIDSFKFDGGESSWLSSLGHPSNSLDNVNDYTRYFTDVAHRSDVQLRMQEVRVSVASQHLPMFTRLMDKDSHWSHANGLRSVIPHILIFGIIGYPFGLPDMIGGNAYNSIFIQHTAWPDRELYIRWLQLTALLPAMQFSVVPWHYDSEVVHIAHEMVALHERYADVIISLAKESTRTGAPIIRPLWWIATEDSVCLTIDSEFLLGSDVLVAPILEEGATSRDIYLPPGAAWRSTIHGEDSGEVYNGGQWLRNYTVAINKLAYFTKV